ncbi:hypothetical protein FJZ19_01160 [Candidatus Pacearchaeota archaeon]|nr:hypothetical protein [Candidatus Pacearchaeota archaeon]
MEKIIQEKISADHLLYVSLKYTKTCDVVLNLIARWRSMMDFSIERLLEVAKKKKLIKSIPSAPKQKIDAARQIYKKNKEIIETIDLYEFFKRIDNLEKIRENEFRKNVALKVLDRGEWINIDMDKLKEYSALLERFISQIKQILS